MLVHGFPADGDMWRHISPSLAEKYTVLAPDLSGSGQSAFQGEDLTVELMAACLLEILDAEQADKAVIAGHSMGGYTSIAFADLYPERLKGLAMVHSSAFADDEEKKEGRRKVISVIRKGAKEAFVKQMVPNLFPQDFELSHQDIVNDQVNDALRLPAESMIAFYNAMMNRNNRVEVLERLKVPVQWIIGKKDNALPFARSIHQSHLSNLNFVSVYEDCGHMSMLEDPKRLVADLDKFMAYCYNY